MSFTTNQWKLWFQNKNIEIYATHSERISVVTERITKTLKTKFYKHMTAVSKNVCIDNLPWIDKSDIL